MDNITVNRLNELTEKVLALEKKRCGVIEGLLSDCMHQLDHMGKKDKENKKEKIGKNKSKPKPSQSTIDHNMEAKERSRITLEQNIELVREFLSDGKSATASEIIENCDLTKKGFYRVAANMNDIEGDGNPNRNSKKYRLNT